MSIPWGQYERAYKAIHNAILSPNRAVKPTIDLSTARTNQSLVEEGVLPANQTFLYLTIMRRGSGTFSLKMKFNDGSTLEYSSDDLQDGYMMERRFVDVLFTNTSQTVTNPVLLVEWKE